MAKTDLSGELQNQISEKIMDIITKVMSQQEAFYNKNPDKVPNENDVNEIISKYSRRSMIASGVAGLAPGPLGMLAVIPEVLAIIDSQIRAIYDVGVAYGKQKFLTKELILGVFASAAVTGTIGILTIQGTKVFVQRTSANLLKRVIQLVAVRTSQGALRSMVGKYVPIVGAAAIAAWSNYSTKQVGRRAADTFSKEIEFVTDSGESEEISEEVIEKSLGIQDFPIMATENKDFEQDQATSKVEDQAELNYLDEIKLQSLINLMLIDNEAHSDEKKYIREIIAQIGLSDERKKYYSEALDKASKFTIDYTSISEHPDESLGLLTDLVALSNHDGKMHISEKMYVKKVGKTLGFSEQDVEEMIASL